MALFEHPKNCQHRVTHSGEVLSSQCGRTAIGTDDGRRYCTIHSPAAIEARSKRQSARWKESLAKATAIREAEEEHDRKAKAYDILIEAMKYARDQARRGAQRLGIIQTLERAMTEAGEK